MATTQDGRSLQLSTPLDKDFLLANRFTCSEGSMSFFISSSTCCTRNRLMDLNPPRSMQNSCWAIKWRLSPCRPRERNAISMECASISPRPAATRGFPIPCRACAECLALTQVTQSRIFQEISVPDILKKVLADFEVAYGAAGQLSNHKLLRSVSRIGLGFHFAAHGRRRHLLLFRAY